MPKDALSKLLFLCGVALSTIAVIIAIKGMMAIFPTSEIIIPTMIGILEVTKLVLAVWVHSNWTSISFMIKGYMSMALVVLMLMTSLSIFGFLSKTHLDQNVPAGDIVAKLSMIDDRIQIETDAVSYNRKLLSQMDNSVEQLVSRSEDTKSIDKSIKVRKSQTKERTLLQTTILESQKKITVLNEERSPIAASVRKIDAEVGPLKYIAALIYGDSLDVSLLEKAVRIVILMIVFVFDPLAVLILISVTGNHKNIIKLMDKIEENKEDTHTSYEIYLEDDVDVNDNITVDLIKKVDI
jgi:hypothetical protein